MNENDFWKTAKEKAAEFLNTVDQSLENVCIWVTDLKNQVSWCSKRMQDLFGISAPVINNFELFFKEYVYSDDQDEYISAMNEWLLGDNLDMELCSRMCEKDGSCCMYSLHPKILLDEKKNPQYLVVTIRNEAIFSEFDPMTDLYSYARYVKDLDSGIAGGERLAILQIQVEGFNTFNLVYGLDYSAALLRQIALTFIYMMDMDKAVYRLESERFVFILKKAGREELLQFEQQVRRTLSDRILISGKNLSLKMSAGAILLEDFVGDSSSVRGQVAYALDHSIHKHQGQLVIFNDEVHTKNGTDLALMKVIHQSVQNNCEDFYLEYQPIVAAKTGEVVGAEALVRWSRKPYGVVPPGMFIEWMETDPSMYDLGNFVLRRALTENMKILKINPDFFVNVNVSVRQLERPKFRKELQSILAETGFPADHLCMELTERCKDFPIDQLREEVLFFQSLGIRVAMDDYGTGSASSSIVMNVPMDEIKIDMSFIRNIMDNFKNQEMVRSILYFAQKSNMATCLEGVENEELQNYLRDYNATWFQGYYYAKPLPVHSLEDMVCTQYIKG